MKLERLSLITVLFLFPLFMFACRDTMSLTGKYMSQGDKDRHLPDIVLILGANGQGSWAGEGDSVDFRWDFGENEIRLHTRSGGVLLGRIIGESIEISLPGTGPLIFKKVKG